MCPLFFGCTVYWLRYGRYLKLMELCSKGTGRVRSIRQLDPDIFVILNESRGSIVEQPTLRNQPIYKYIQITCIMRHIYSDALVDLQ